MVETLPTPKIETLLPDADEQPPARRLLTREEYHQMTEEGIFGPDERVELIHGEVYQKMSPQKSGHFSTIEMLAEALKAAFGDGFTVRRQGPILFGDKSEPEPDISVVSGAVRDYVKNHPRLADAILIAEVSDTTLRTDRTLKASLYAEAGVKDYWIVDLKARTIEVYREPAATPTKGFPFGYKSRRIYSEDENVSPLAVPDSSIAVADILPPE